MSLPSHPRPLRLASIPVLVALTFLIGTATATGATLSGAAGSSGTVTATASGSTTWVWPLDPPHTVARPFIAPATPYSSGHRGIDLHGAVGSAVYAPAGGVVHFSGFVVDRPVISIRHPGGLVSSFEPVISKLVAGTVVHRGDTIGALQSGHCGAPCLHFGVRLHGEYVSPLGYLGGIPRSVLLPTRPLR
ncbi:MAG TPA: M23 family metallopeptidase [Terrimesophilobacter sp.]|nr:M23 family metallopeptidase [Terrimesophilobacter sp.]